MKQTNGAVTLLLSAFKSIYRNAYVKGIASAVVLTAGLTAGQAGAGVLNKAAIEAATVTDETVFNVTGEDAGGVYENLSITENASSTDAFTVNITKDTTPGTSNVVAGSAAVDATFSKSTWNVTTGGKDSGGFIIKGAASGVTSKLTIDTLNLNSGKVIVSGGASDAGAATLAAMNLNIGAAPASVALENVNAVIEIGSDAADVVGIKGNAGADQYDKSSAINLNNGGQIAFVGANGTLQGRTLNINGGHLTVEDNGKSGSVSVADGSMNGGSILVGSGAELEFSLTSLQNGEAAKGVTPYAAKKFTANGGTINVAGTLTLSGDSTATGGDAVFDFSQAGLTLSAVTEDTVTSGEANIAVAGNSENDTVLRISTANLNQYLNKDTAADTEDNTGAVSVAQYGVLEFSDATELNKFNWTNGTLAGGAIGINKGTIRGADLTVNGQLKKNASTASDMVSGSIVATNSLTLGEDIDTFVGTTGIVNAATALEQVVAQGLFETKSDDFTINANTVLGDLDKNADETVMDTTTGTFKGGALTVSGSTAISVDVLGNYEFDISSLEIGDKATINVGSGDYANVKVGATTLKSTASSADSKIIVSGGTNNAATAEKPEIIHEATLDLSSVTSFEYEPASATKQTQLIASGDGTIIVNGRALAEELKTANTGASGFAFVLNGGDYEVTGGLSADVQSLVSCAAATPSGSVMTFDGTNGGILSVTGGLTLTTSADANDLDIGSKSAIVADSLTLTNKDEDGTKFTVTTGDITVQTNLTSNVDVEFKAANNTLAQLTLGDSDLENQGGTVSADITFSGAQSIDQDPGTTSGAGLIVNDGTWNVTGALTFTGAANAFIGDGEFADGNDAAAAETTLTIAQLSNTGTGIITVNPTANVTLGALNLGTTGALTVNGGEATITGAAYTNNSGSTAEAKAEKANYDLYGAYGLKYEDDKLSVTNSGKLTITGTALSGLFDDGVDSTGNFTVTKAVAPATEDTVTANTNSAYGTIGVDGNATLRLDFGEGTSFTMAEYRALKKALITGSDLDSNDMLNSGRIDLGAAQVTGYTDLIKVDANGYNYVEDWDKIAALGDVSDLAQDDMVAARIEGIEADDHIGGNYGSLHGTDNVSTIQIATNTSLNFAEGNEGFFASYELGNQTVAAGVDVAAGVEFTLNNGGKIGAVTLYNGSREEDATTLYVNNVEGGSTEIASVNCDAGISENTAFITKGGSTTVTGNVNTGYYEVGGTDTVKGTLTADDVTVVAGGISVENTANVDEIYVENGYFASTSDVAARKGVNTKALYIGANGQMITGALEITSDAFTTEASVINGTLVADSLSLDLDTYSNAEDSSASDEFVIADGQVAVNGELEAQAGTYIRVGLDATEDRESAGGLLWADSLTLNGAAVIVDPSEGDLSYFGTAKFTNAPTTGAKAGHSMGALDGVIATGKNSTTVLGANTLEDAAALVQEVGSVGGTTRLIIDSTMDFTGNGLLIGSSALTGDQLKAAIEDGDFAGHDMVMGEGYSVVVTQDALDDALAVRNATTGAVDDHSVFNKTGGVNVLAQGGKIIVDVDNVTETIALFNDGSKVDETSTADLTVSTVSGLLADTFTKGEALGDVDLKFQEDVAETYRGRMSDPVFNAVMAYAAGNVTPFDDTDDANGASDLHSGIIIDQTAYEALTEAERADYQAVAGVANTYEKKVYNGFLNDVVKNGTVEDAESVARLAVYGGAAEVALAASSVTSDAIASRMGMGNPNGNLVMADSEKGAGLWLAPMYKNHESDNFDAQGVDYGVDLDLTGVALGADYTFGSNIRGGAMFAIGSGDADGQGAGSAVSNDFDFWSVGVYGGYAYEAFSLTADLSWTQVDNDIDANTAAAGKVSASMDADVLSAGLTAKYDLDLDMVKVAPHLGMRYTSIDIDDYSVSGIASSDVDSISVFSIPVGVMFSTDIATASGWNVKPALDLTLTVNTGDDEVDSDVRFNGVDMTTDLTSEFIDNVTYGATVGVQVQKDAFQFGLGVNYTGSDNTDEFGVGANARFTF